MFAAVREAGATAVAELLWRPELARERESLTNQFAAAANGPLSLREAFQAFQDSKGRVSFQSLAAGGANSAMSDGSVRFLKATGDMVWRAMLLGVYGEK